MTAAGMGTSMILGNLVGMLTAPEGPKQEGVVTVVRTPTGLRRVEEEQQKKARKRAPPLPSGSVDRARLVETIRAGSAWYDKNFSLKVNMWQSYYLYSVERYMSFQEHLSGEYVEEPAWYNDGFELLRSSQAKDGSWNDSAGPECATAFSVLFLMRSTQKSIQLALGEGTLIGGRGLPSDLSKLRVRGGRLVAPPKPTDVDTLLDMLDQDNPEAFDQLLDNPAAMQIENAGPDDARRLQQVAKSGPAGARLLAVEALGKLRSMDQAPTLIFALSDPDRRVVRAARDGLRSISRNVEGFGPSDNFDDGERSQAVDRWKQWYRSVRPDAPPLP
jgi:hypothetical protein